MAYLADAGRHDEMRILYNMRGVKFGRDAVVNAGIRGHVGIVDWLVGNLVIGGDDGYERREKYVCGYGQMQLILEESIRRSDNLVVVKAFMEHEVYIYPKSLVIAKACGRLETVKCLEPTM